MIEQRFGESAPWSIGVEEELILVDEQTFDLVPAAARVLEGAGDELKGELFLTMIETTTGICATPDEAFRRMRELRAHAAKRAEREGLRVLASGSHPFARPEDQPITDDPHYVEFVSFGGPVARRQSVCGLHVHVGMPDAETCVRAVETVLPWLPLVLALSANSPFFRGAETGLLSSRAETLATLPRAGAPPEFDSYAEWEATMERWLRAGLIRKYTNVWWDVRVHPSFGTLEVRIADQPTDLEVARKLVESVHALAVRAARDELPRGSRDDYQSNRFAAARFGPRARLVWGERLATVADLVNELGLDLDATTCEADRQLEHRNDLVALTGDLVARTTPR